MHSRLPSARLATSRLRYRETIVDGLDKAPDRMTQILDGDNFGKVFVRLADPETDRARSACQTMAMEATAELSLPWPSVLAEPCARYVAEP
jgi:hypothetical protein